MTLEHLESHRRVLRLNGSHDAGLPPDLARAADGWLRQGYSLIYSDGHLAQLTRQGLPPRRQLVLGGIFALALSLTGLGLALMALRLRSWHVVSLTRTPTEKILVHSHWTEDPPPR